MTSVLAVVATSVVREKQKIHARILTCKVDAQAAAKEFKPYLIKVVRVLSCTDAIQ